MKAGIADVSHAKRARLGSAPSQRLDLSWVLDTPADVHDKAAAELATAYSTGNKVHGRGNFEVQFRCAKRLAQESITINARDWGRKGGEYAGIFRADRLRSSEPLPGTIEREFKVVRTRLGRYYLAIPVPLETRRSENQAPVEAVAIDPGARTFITTFDTTGNVHQFGAESIARIRRL
jgi:transposase